MTTLNKIAWIPGCLAPLMLASCHTDDLCYDHPHGAEVNVHIDTPAALAQRRTIPAMTVYFYPVDNQGEPRRFDINGASSGRVRLREGTYHVIAYNNDSETVRFHSTDKFDSHHVHTREADLLEPLYGRAGETEKTILAPDNFSWAVVRGAEISEGVDVVIPITESLSDYTVTLTNVANANRVSQIVVSLSGMASGLTLSTGELDTECCTISAEAAVDRKNLTVTASFSSFGFRADSASPNRVGIYAIMDDGSKVSVTSLPQLDVTDQLRAAPDPRMVDITVDGVELPKPASNPGSGGFNPTVDDWNDDGGTFFL